MFIEQGVHVENKFWKYIIGSLAIILASTLGQIPLLLAVFIKSLSEGKNIPTKRLHTQVSDVEENNKNNGLTDRINKKSLSPYIHGNNSKKE